MRIILTINQQINVPEKTPWCTGCPSVSLVPAMNQSKLCYGHNSSKSVRLCYLYDVKYGMLVELHRRGPGLWLLFLQHPLHQAFMLLDPRLVTSL